MHKDLSALCDKDLELFGIKNAETRREMVVKLVNLPNQMVHFEKFVSCFTFKHNAYILFMFIYFFPSDS